MSDTLSPVLMVPDEAPAGVTVTESEGRLETYRALDADSVRMTLTYRWFRRDELGVTMGALAFCLAWNALVVVAGVVAVRGPGLLGPQGLVLAVFGFFGVVMTRNLVAHLVNRTTVRVTGRTVSVQHGPVPCGGGVRVGKSEIEAVFCQRDRQFPGRAGEGAAGEPIETSYGVVLRLRSGRELSITTSLSRPTLAQGRFLERRVREQLDPG